MRRDSLGDSVYHDSEATLVECKDQRKSNSHPLPFCDNIFYSLSLYFKWGCETLCRKSRRSRMSASGHRLPGFIPNRISTCGLSTFFFTALRTTLKCAAWTTYIVRRHHNASNPLKPGLSDFRISKKHYLCLAWRKMQIWNKARGIATRLQVAREDRAGWLRTGWHVTKAKVYSRLFNSECCSLQTNQVPLRENQELVRRSLEWPELN